MPNKPPIQAFFALILISIVLWIIHLFFKKNELHKIKIPKRTIVTAYGVDKKTFRKWVLHFGQEIFPDIKAYDKLRKLDLITIAQLVTTFGLTSDGPVLSKKDIVLKGEGTYKSLRESIRCYPDKFGIGADAFAALHRFPPSIGQKILEAYGV